MDTRVGLGNDGRVAFLSFAETRVEGDTNGEADAFLFVPDPLDSLDGQKPE